MHTLAAMTAYAVDNGNVSSGPARTPSSTAHG
jgi:hypothetical protein